MDTRRPNVWFIGAWVFLVLVVAAAFFRQEQKLNDIEGQIRLTNAVVSVRLQEFSPLCRLLIEEYPVDKDKIIDAFAQWGVDCSR